MAAAIAFLMAGLIVLNVRSDGAVCVAILLVLAGCSLSPVGH